MKTTYRAFFVIFMLTFAPRVQAVETVIIGGVVGNGDFEDSEDPGDAGLITGAITYANTVNWFNAQGTGADEDINFTNDSQTGGSTQANSRAGMPFQNRTQVNDTGYTIQSAGEVFNISYDFGAGGGPAGWNGGGDETMRTFLFTATAPVDGMLTTANMTELAGSVDLYDIDRANDPQWTTRSTPQFYTSTAGDIGQTVYFGMQFLNDSGPDLFPRIDLVRLTTGTPEPFLLEFNAAENTGDGENYWAPNVDQGPMTGGMPTEIFTFAGNTSSNPVNDASVPGITASYSAGSQSRGPSYSDGVPGTLPSAFEVWFKPDSLSEGDQVIAEFGGGQNGSYLSLQNNTLSFFSTTNQANPGNQTLSTTLSSAEWTQVVANWDGVAGEYELFVNGVEVDSATGTLLGRWGGANQWGLGQVGGDTGDDLAVGGPLTTPATLADLALAGEIGIFRYYDKTLSATEVLASYEAIAAEAGGVPGDFNNDGVVNIADYTVWRNNLGGSFDLNGNGDETGDSAGVVDAADYALWKDNFGNSGAANAALSSTNVPEPGAVVLVLVMGVAGSLARKAGS